MTVNLLIKTTFKNNLSLLKPFYEFHKDVWDPRRFCFIVGYTGTEKEEIEKIAKILPFLIFEKGKPIGDIRDLVTNMNMFNHENIYFFLYKTPEKYAEPSTWDRLKGDIFKKIDPYIDDGKFKRHLTVDNDDFHYVKNPKESLGKDLVFFHSVELIPGKRLISQMDFDFISCRYFFRIKGTGGKVSNNCHHCSVIEWKKFNNVSHYFEDADKKIKKCKGKLDDYHNGINVSKLEELDGFCFSFSCPSLQFLLNEKHWLNTTSKPTMTHSLEKGKIIEDFEKNYTLNEKELSSVKIFRVNDIKKYFFT